MIRRFTTYVALVTCDVPNTDCEAIIREVAESQHMADMIATSYADHDGWTRVGTGHRCPQHPVVSLVKTYARTTYVTA